MRPRIIPSGLNNAAFERVRQDVHIAGTWTTSCVPVHNHA